MRFWCSCNGAVLTEKRSFSPKFESYSANCNCIWGCAWGSKYYPVTPIANICLLYRRSKIRQCCTRVGAVLTEKRSFSSFSIVLVQIAIVFEVAHGDLNTSPYSPLQTSVLYIDGKKVDTVALAMKPCWPRNGCSVTFSLVSVQIALVFEVAHGDRNTSLLPIANMCLLYRRSKVRHRCSCNGAVLTEKRSFSSFLIV
jgi:hypothetical protein